MKHQLTPKRLTINKETIAHLNRESMSDILGGKETLLFMSEPDSTCFSLMACTQEICPSAACTSRCTV